VKWQKSETPSLREVRLIARLEGATNPESAELLDDGETIVFGNCTMTVGLPAYRAGAPMPVYLQGEAFVSRARLHQHGAEVQVKRLVDGLTSALGIDILRRATSTFPAGTAFIATGGRPITKKGASELISDPAMIRQQALAFDPFTGERRGAIPLWAGSPIAEKFNVLDQPNGLAIDRDGDVYVGDIPNSNPDADGAPPGPSAIYRIPHAALDALNAHDAHGAQSVERILVPGFVNGATAAADGAIFIVSCSRHDPARGGVYRLTREDFAEGRLPEPIVQGLGILDGVGFTRRGTVLASNPISGDLHAFTAQGEHMLLRVAGENVVDMPADFNVVYPAHLNGEPALLAPDISVGKAPGEGVIAVVDISGL